jgi:radical SAM protein with 4Fe4S-binding SPASM domain
MRLFYLQWHITAKCRNDCIHCYITDDEKRKKGLSFEKAKRIVNDFVFFCKKWNLRKRLLLTGGDPLLCPYFWELISYIQDRDKTVEINVAGNPELLNEKIIRKLEKGGILCYQLSIDGLEKTHDLFRYHGSFKETLKKIKLLSNSDIMSVGLSTVSSLNLNDIPTLVKILFENGIQRWDFARYVKTPENKETKPILPEKYRDFLFLMKESYQALGLTKEMVGRKDPLWTLVEKPKSLKNYNKRFFGGCGIGSGSLDVLHDGTVMACRRHLGSIIGKMPDQKIEDIFFFSEKMNLLRKVEKISKCRNCEFLWHCRGCRAVAFGETRSYFTPDPQCWLKTKT